MSGKQLSICERKFDQSPYIFFFWGGGGEGGVKYVTFMKAKANPPTCPAAPHSSGGSDADLRTGGRWFDPRLGQYSVRGLIVIATGFIPLPPLSVVSTMVMWESSQWLRKNIVRSTG